MLRVHQIEIAFALRLGRLQLAFGDLNLQSPHRPSVVLIRSLMLTVVFAMPSNTRFPRHSFDFWDKFWDKRFGGLEPCWNQQLRKVW